MLSTVIIFPCVPLLQNFGVVGGAFTCIVSSNMTLSATILAGVFCVRKKVLSILEAIASIESVIFGSPIESLGIAWTPSVDQSSVVSLIVVIREQHLIDEILKSIFEGPAPCVLS